MKRFCLTSAIAVFLLFCLNEVQAQADQTKLDQLKLMHSKWWGTWQQDYGKDTIEVSEGQQHENIFIATNYRVIKGKKSFWAAYNYAYSPKENSFKMFILSPNGNYQTMIGSFTAENKFSADIVQNFDPAKVLRRVEIVFDTPTSYTATFYNLDGTKRRAYKWYKVK